jgi:2-dehydropantoate 2-reductase
MSDVPSKVVWVGVGAVGLLYSARLIRAGVDVELLLKSDYDAATQNGLHIRSVDGDFQVPPTAFRAHRSASTLPPADLVIISTKTTANHTLPATLAPCVRPGTRLLTLQNGFGNEAFLARHFPEARVYGATAFVSVHRIAPATADHQHSGHLAIGQYTPGSDAPDGSVEPIASLLRRTGFRVAVMPSLARGRWEKQLWNVPFNGLGAALDLDTERLLSTPEGEGLVRAIMAEVIAVARADGTELPPGMVDDKIRYTRTMGPYRTSMQLDRRAGRPMEIHAIVGSVCRRAAELQVPTPQLRVLETLLLTADTSKHPQPKEIITH